VPATIRLVYLKGAGSPAAASHKVPKAATKSTPASDKKSHNGSSPRKRAAPRPAENNAQAPPAMQDQQSSAMQQDTAGTAAQPAEVATSPKQSSDATEPKTPAKAPAETAPAAESVKEVKSPAEHNQAHCAVQPAAAVQSATEVASPNPDPAPAAASEPVQGAQLPAEHHQSRCADQQAAAAQPSTVVAPSPEQKGNAVESVSADPKLTATQPTNQAATDGTPPPAQRSASQNTTEKTEAPSTLDDLQNPPPQASAPQQPPPAPDSHERSIEHLLADSVVRGALRSREVVNRSPTGPTRTLSERQLQERPRGAPTRHDAWFEDGRSDARVHKPPPHIATPEAARATTKPDSRAAHDRRPLPNDETNQPAPSPTSPPQLAPTHDSGHEANRRRSFHAHFPVVAAGERQPQPRRERPAPIAASSDDIAPALRPLLFELANKYQLSQGYVSVDAKSQSSRRQTTNAASTGGAVRHKPSTRSGAMGEPYARDTEEALGLRKPRAALERQAEIRRRAQEETFLAEQQAGRRLLAPVRVPGGDTQLAHAFTAHPALSAPVQRPPPRQVPHTLSPLKVHGPGLRPSIADQRAPAGTAVGGVPFEQLPRAEQRRVVVALAEAIAAQERDLTTDTSQSAALPGTLNNTHVADEHRRHAAHRRHEEEHQFRDFVQEQQQRALFEQQQKQRKQDVDRQPARHHHEER
jgi:hypothetical protein